MSDSIPVETVIEARWVVPVAPRGQVLEQHAVVVEDGCITDVLPISDARQRYSAAQVVSLPDHALIPGLINLHTRAATVLLRGFAEELSLVEGLQRTTSAEAQVLSEAFVRDGTWVACAEMLRGGVTCFNDMYAFPVAAAESAQRAGMRASLGLIVQEAVSAYASDADDYLHKGLAARDALNDNSLISTCLAPVAPQYVSDKTFAKVLTYADQLNINLHVCLHETQDEISRSISEHGMRPVQRLAGLGLLGPNLLAAHCVQLQAADIELLATQGCHIAHCPTSNLKLANSIMPLNAIQLAGINTGLGTDAATGNTRLDLFGEMRLAALLSKSTGQDTAAVSSAMALEMATINAARALGLEQKIGSIAGGKCADLTAVDFSGVEMQPCYDVISHLVHVAGREQVSHVWVQGKLLVEDGHLTRIQRPELNEKMILWQNRLNKYRQ